MSEYLPYDEIIFDRNIELEDILKTPDDSDIEFYLEVVSKNLDEIK